MLKQTLRYYDEPQDEAAVISRTVCKNCGAEGQHKTSACPVQIVRSQFMIFETHHSLLSNSA